MDKKMTKDRIRKNRTFGKGSRRCRRCNTHVGLIRKYGLLYCRRCFREVARDLGFSKF